jgi:hypothetical protein
VVRDDHIHLREIAHRLWIEAGRPRISRAELFREAEKILADHHRPHISRPQSIGSDQVADRLMLKRRHR